MALKRRSKAASDDFFPGFTEIVEIGVGIDNDRVLPAHLANDALQFALTFSRFSAGFPDFQTDFARAGESDQIDLGMIDRQAM